MKLIITHSTGLRNPSLYELYGSDNYGFTGNKYLNPEKSETNELFLKYSLFNNLSLLTSFYKTKIYDRIELNSSFSTHENKKIDINQEGLESQFLFKDKNNKISLFSNFTKSRTASGVNQSRRPDISYGLNYDKKLQSKIFGKYNIIFNYKYTGKYLDWDGSDNTFQKSTDIVDLSAQKNLSGSFLTLSIQNLLNERYEKPATYTQDGRNFRIGFRKSY